MRDASDLPPSAASPEETRVAFAKVDSRLGASNSERHRAVLSHRQPHFAWSRYVGIAAGIVVVLGAAAFGLWSPESANRSTPFRTFASATGSRSTITLRDGTRVVLAPASQIRIPTDFGRGTRTVLLDGEAYFAVVHDQRHPFFVQAQHVTVQDIGTEFDVRAYPEDRDVRVAVARGSVSFAAARAVANGPYGGNGYTEPFQLEAGDVAEATDTGRVVAHHVDIAELTGWLQGRLVFNNTPLSQVAQDLSRVFDLSITVADSALAVQHFTGDYDQETAEQVLDDIMRSAGARYERRGRTVVIRRVPADSLGTYPHHSPQPLTTAAVSTHVHE